MNSIIQTEKRCFNCGNPYNLHLHHIFFGKNRKNADKDGLTCYLCLWCHEGTNGVHGKNGHELDLKLKRLAEQKWCKYYNKTPQDFRKRYYCNYL